MKPGFDRALRAPQHLTDFLVAEFFLVVHHEARSVVVSEFSEGQFEFFADVELLLLMFLVGLFGETMEDLMLNLALVDAIEPTHWPSVV